ncbi:MAG: rod shape-determining protein MreD [Solirubrobacteraceae bacterium]|nr:rod shape-determining protein MreD [Solirubrobacteraceae bacterium]
MRVGALALLAALFQPALFSRIDLLGMRLDLALLTLLMASLLAGPVTGAAMGFAMGLMLDLVSGQTLGLTSLAYVLVGYGVGRLGMLRDPDSSAVPVVVGLAGTAAGLALYGLLHLMLSQGARISDAIIWETGGTVLLGTLLALPVHNRIKRWLLPMLPEEARRRRRRRTYGTRRASASDADVRIR